MREVVHKLEIGAALSAMTSNVRLNIGPMLGVALAVGIAGGLLDTVTANSSNSAGNFILFFASIYATHMALRTRIGADSEIKPHAARALGINFLTFIGIFVGLLLLILPGLMLFTRWAVAIPAMMRENLSITEAMRRSAELTAGNRWPILGLSLVLWAPFLVLMVLVGGLAAAFLGETVTNGAPFNIVLNTLSALTTILGAILWTECYLRLAGEARQDALAEIFA
ncbi:MAG TPA: glycerophosphoryl diester phosphodiesterase membrane domain-containing protein [Sphingobium sp.]